MEVIEINGVPFTPRADCVSRDGGRRTGYKHDYLKVAKYVEAHRERGNLTEEYATYRNLILNDLWFVLYFVVKPWSDDAGRAMVNHPFVVQACRDVEEGPLDSTLDIWARFHFKSSIITTAETIQYQLRNPNAVTGIFSGKASVAKDFLWAIRSVFEKERILSTCFPETVWVDCPKEAPIWSQDEGIILKRTTNRKEASVSAHGLIEGMPIGLHFERMVYDDITNQDMADSPDVMEKVKVRFDSSRNLKTLVNSHHRVIGTFYHHADPLVYIRGKKNLAGGDRYTVRLKPATEDGTATGRPVLMTQEALDDLKDTTSFNCQQLLDPSPVDSQKLNPDFLVRVEKEFVPRDLYRVMLVDQAGDLATNKSGNTDSWAIGLLGIQPGADAIGQSNVYLLDACIEPLGETEAIERIVQMFLRGGMIQKLGVEKVAMSATHVHVAAALKARGRHVVFDEPGSVGVLLRPAGRNKKTMIEKSLAWPLNNGKIHYSTAVPPAYIERLKMEMTNFPLWHDDGINMLAYLYDIIGDLPLGSYGEEDRARVRALSYKPVCAEVGY